MPKAFKDYLSEVKQRKKIYYRGTDNHDEDVLVGNKTLLPSLNHITNDREIGISVSDVPSVSKYFKYMYKLTGKEVGEGSDGEPLLDPATIEFIKWVKH